MLCGEGRAEERGDVDSREQTEEQRHITRRGIVRGQNAWKQETWRNDGERE